MNEVAIFGLAVRFSGAAGGGIFWRLPQKSGARFRNAAENRLWRGNLHYHNDHKNPHSTTCTGRIPDPVHVVVGSVVTTCRDGDVPRLSRKDGSRR
ncbi:hypothetical protein FDG2_4456 [Candidatus Protofrankia californiensis]|uniref:Uncharacterized protein n=1 Tax=Candidatus Protofrankia californiensis TaxID=1839754 RepID=A0A1C3P5U7_9ACTN|nr:hypothetical protein FDG2_4456 [Candidatus Protofrankia californiensis]